MRERVVAKRYSHALFEVAMDQGLLEQVQRGLDEFAAIFSKVSLLSKNLDNDELPLAVRHKLVDAVCKEMNIAQFVTDFLKLLVSKRRIGLIEFIASIHHDLVAEAMNFTRAEASVSDRSLGADVKKSIEKLLEEKLGRPARCEVSVRPEQLGGIILKIGDKMLDASVKGRLEQFKEALIKT